MISLRSLEDVKAAARRHGLEVVSTMFNEALIECPLCQRAGQRQLACVELVSGILAVRCAGCDRWDANPRGILRVLAREPARRPSVSKPPSQPRLEGRVLAVVYAAHARGLEPALAADARYVTLKCPSCRTGRATIDEHAATCTTVECKPDAIVAALGLVAEDAS